MKIVNNDSGYVLFLVLLTILLVTVIGFSLMSTTANVANLTTIERSNQSAYYIAEAGLIEARNKADHLVAKKYNKLYLQYEQIKNQEIDGALKKQLLDEFDFNGKFADYLVNRLSSDMLAEFPANQKIYFKDQFGFEPYALLNFTVARTAEGVKMTLKSNGYVPNQTNSTISSSSLSQNINFSTNIQSSTETITTTKTNVFKYNACYALYSATNFNMNQGTINGDIYVNGNFNLQNAGGNANGNIIAEGNVTIQGANVEKNIFTNGTFSIANAGARIKGSVFAEKNATLNGSTIEGSVMTKEDLLVAGGVMLNQNVIANNIRIQQTPGNIAGKVFFGNNVVDSTNYRTNNAAKFERRSDFINMIETQKQSMETSICLKDKAVIPSLPEVSTSFPVLQGKILPNQSISDGNNNHNVIVDGNLNINSWLINNRNYKLDMDEDLRFNTITINQNLTLKIDMKGKDRKLYVSNLNISQGHIELINAGNLEIIVGSNMSINGVLNTNANKEKLTVRYSGVQALNLSNNSKINGSLYVKQSPKIDISSQGVAGDLIVFNNSTITISGASMVGDTLLLAPLATLNLTQGGGIKGNVVAGTMTISGGTTITPPTTSTGIWEGTHEEVENVVIPIYSSSIPTFMKQESIIQVN